MYICVGLLSQQFIFCISRTSQEDVLMWLEEA